MSGFTASEVDCIIQIVKTWAENEPEIHAAAVVGSWARKQARADSDLDLMLLTPQPELFFDNYSFQHLPWHTLELEITDYYDRIYGVVRSRHLCFSRGQRIEFSFGYRSWADTEPIDLGTYRVISSGLKVIYDRKRLLANLIATIGSG